MGNRKIEALSRVSIFAGCRPDELQFLASRADEVDAAVGQTLIRQGTPSDTFYILLEGEAEVQVDGKPLPVLREGDFFGEISMLDRGPATATVVATTPARLLVMSHAQFRDAIKGNNALLSNVISAMAQRLRRDSLNRSAT